jgi:MFS family permease
MSISSKPHTVLTDPVPAMRPVAGSGALPFYFGWVQIVIAAAAMTGTTPGRTHGLGLITSPLLRDMDITESVYGILNAIAILVGAAFCLPGGRFIDRLGSRTMLTATALALGIVVLVMSTVTNWWTLLSVLVLVRGLGQGTLSVVSLALPGKWFRRRLGPAMGLFAVLLAFGFIAATLGMGAGISIYGWRIAWASFGAWLLLFLAPLSWLLVRNSPEECGLIGDEPPTTATNEKTPAAEATLIDALHSPAFWVFGCASSLFGLLWSAITLFNEKILAEHGFSAETFYAVMGLLTLGGLVTNLLGGWLATRWPLGRLLAAGMICLAGALAAFPWITSMTQVLVYGFVLGMAGGLITVVYFTFFAQTFGRTHLGKIQGAAQILSVLSSALGPVLLALAKDTAGTYDVFFISGAVLALPLAGAVWLVPLPRRSLPKESV